MSKKTLLILIILIVFVGAIGFFALLNQNQIPNIETLETENQEFIPFSQSGTRGLGDGDQVQGNTPFVFPGRQNVFDIVAEDSKLSQVTQTPVAGYTLFSKTVEIVEEPSIASESLVDTYNFFEYSTLKIGDEGSSVQALQTVLNRVFPEQTIAVDGVFTTETKNSVIAFQTSNNLGSDGVVGNLTKAKLNQFQGISTNPGDFEPTIREEQYFTIRYQDKTNGKIFDLGVEEKTFEEISSTSFAAIYESFFGNNGGSVVVRYENNGDISTFLGDIVPPQTFENQNGETETLEGYIEGEFLAPGIPFVSVNPEGTGLLFFEKLRNGSRGFIYDFATKNTRTVFESAFWEWLPQFNGPEVFSLTSRASALSLGYSYRYDATEKNEFTKGIGGWTGLTTNYNPSGSKVLYSTNNGARFIETYVYDFNDGTTLSLGIKTLAEKCVWQDVDMVLCAVPEFVGPEDYPDAWYKGEIRFDDQMWRINTENGKEEIISTLSNDTTQTIEAVDLHYKDGIVLFTNRYDHSLWMLDLR